jgi:DNA-directed RNA polymerase specialized sigma24 family protein
VTTLNENSPPDRWALYERSAPAIRAYAARRVEPDAVDDIVADTFAIAWRRLPREATRCRESTASPAAVWMTRGAPAR